MKRTGIALALAMSLSTVACVSDEDHDPLAIEDVPTPRHQPPMPGAGTSTPAPEPSASPRPAVQAIAVRLRGVGSAGQHVRVTVAALDVIVDGLAIPVVPTTAELDLGDSTQAWRIATFDLPSDAHQVSIRLRIQPLGTVERDGVASVLDIRGPPMSVVVDASWARARDKVVLDVDLGRSLVERDGLFMIPGFVVRY